MNEKVSDSIKYLMAEYKRLIEKEHEETLSIGEKETLESLKKFLGKS